MIDSGEFQDFEQNYSGKCSHVPSQPAGSRSKSSICFEPRLKNAETLGNVFGNSRSMFDSSQTPYQGILHSTNPSATSAIPVQVGTGRLFARSEERIGSNTNADECKKAVNYEFILTSGNFT